MYILKCETQNTVNDFETISVITYPFSQTHSLLIEIYHLRKIA